MLTTFTTQFVLSDEGKAEYTADFFHRLISVPGRLGLSILIAALAIGSIFIAKSGFLKFLLVLGAFGGFWWGWWLYNSFANHLKNRAPLLGNHSAINSFGDLFHGWNFVFFALGILAWFIVARLTKGFLGWLAGFLAFTGVLIVINLIANLKAH